MTTGEFILSVALIGTWSYLGIEYQYRSRLACLSACLTAHRDNFYKLEQSHKQLATKVDSLKAEVRKQGREVTDLHREMASRFRDYRSQKHMAMNELERHEDSEVPANV